MKTAKRILILGFLIGLFFGCAYFTGNMTFNVSLAADRPDAALLLRDVKVQITQVEELGTVVQELDAKAHDSISENESGKLCERFQKTFPLFQAAQFYIKYAEIDLAIDDFDDGVKKANKAVKLLKVVEKELSDLKVEFERILKGPAV